jgi:signal transduction histidine kinase
LINDCRGLTVFADSLLRQLFYNLIDNSLKYGEKTSKIRVHYEVEKNQVKLIYDDDGVGIPEEMRENLFSEGFGKGSGYGLYLIKRICEAYGWTILETGKHGQGVQFTMVIPEKGKDGKSNYEIS